MDEERRNAVAPPFSLVSSNTLAAWWHNLKDSMAKANKALEAYEKAKATLEQRRSLNGWNETTYRDIFKNDIAVSDAMDAWRFHCAEVARFEAAINAAHQMWDLRLKGRV